LVVKTKIKDPDLIQKRQKQICRGAMRVFRHKGFHSASIREIAKASRISLGSLYDYIEKKEDILFLVHSDILDRIYECLNMCMDAYESPIDQLTHALQELLNLSCEMKDEMLFIYTETKSLESKYLHEILKREAEFTDSFEKLIQRGVDEGVFDCPKPRLVSNIIILVGAIMPLRGWNILPYHSSEEIVEELIHITLKALNVRGESVPGSKSRVVAAT